MSSDPIHIKPSHKGLLHEKLGVPQGQPIPAAKIEKAEQSSSPSLRSEAQFADNAKDFKHNTPVNHADADTPTKGGRVKR